MNIEAIKEAKKFMKQEGLEGWLLYNYHSSNPIFKKIVGHTEMVTRPAFLLVHPEGKPTLLVHHVDAGRFNTNDVKLIIFSSRAEMVKSLKNALGGAVQIAMEHSSMGILPRASWVDGGTLELIRTLGVNVISSANLFQYATQRWTDKHLKTHKSAANKLETIVHEAFTYISNSLPNGPTEHEVAQLIRSRFKDVGLMTPDGPVVAVNQHASDPHFMPSPTSSSPIVPGDWILIDLWAREKGVNGMFADITLVAFAGKRAPDKCQEVFQIVKKARDLSLDGLTKASSENLWLQGWEMDKIARDVINESGYGPYFTHRLGHSLGREVHSDAVNLDSYETYDTRLIIPGIGFTIEPGIYLPDFGVRSEINVFMSQQGPTVTSVVQDEILMLG